MTFQFHCCLLQMQSEKILEKTPWETRFVKPKTSHSLVLHGGRFIIKYFHYKMEQMCLDSCTNFSVKCSHLNEI